MTASKRAMAAIRRIAPACAALCLVAYAFAGCGSASPTPNSDPPATFSAIYPLIFPAETNAKCDSCHAMPAAAVVSNGGLHMGIDKATAYAALVGKKSTPGGTCANRTLVVPNDPDMSLLWQKLSPTPPCGSRMPFGGMPLPDQQIQMVRSWIAAGAQDD
jgi:hypothetical protein